MQKNGFYAVYIEASSQVVAFHNLPLEQVDANKTKVVLTCEGVSHIIVKDDLSKFKGKESEFFVQNGKLKKKKENQIRRQKLEMELNEIKTQIASAISMQFDLNQEIKVTKEFMEWIKDGQPKGDPRVKKFTEMQEKIMQIKYNFSNRKTEIVNELASLN